MDEAKRVRDIHMRLASPPYEQFFVGDARTISKPNPSSCFLIDLAAFTASPGEERESTTLGPVRVVRTYVDGPQGIGRNNQLFVSWAGPHKGRPVTKQRLSHFLVEAITMASSNEVLQSPEGLCAHSTRR